jgi:hypothetical protein
VKRVLRRLVAGIHTLDTISALDSALHIRPSFRMNRTLISKLALGFGAAVLLLAMIGETAAQVSPQYPGYPRTAARNPACLRLEAQLASVDRGGFDPARADQIKRYEDAAAKQQSELDRVLAQSRRLGCSGGGFFSLFGGQPPQCSSLNTQIQRMRGNLDDILGELQRLQGNSADREGQRRSILIALGQNDCGPQYRQFANRSRDLFETLFGPGPSVGADVPASGTFRTVCVRTCDGFFFPVSYATVPGRFAEDEQVCRRMCPAAEVALYSHRNPGEDINQAVSTTGTPYSELPNAFLYRKEFNPACSCRRPGETWADALKGVDDQTLERGDIVVTEERAKQLSQPRTDAQGKPIRPNPPAAKATPAPAAADKPDATEPGKRKVRSVGPTFYPVR